MLKTGRRRQAAGLAATVMVAVAVTAGVAFLVVRADPRAGVAEALKTGGLSGAAVVALYGLWLNDRRRRVEEDRQGVEEERLRVDGGRVSHERFARAVELLGNDADQVRVGALHALVGLARDTPSYTQTVVDVLCSYLRRPFFHRSYVADGADPDRHLRPAPGPLTDADAADDRERQVRLAAQRVLLDLLPGADSTGPDHDLDLSGASLEYFDLRGRRIGDLVARGATTFGITRLTGAVFTGRALFSGAVFHGRVELAGCRFLGGLALVEARFAGPVDLTGAYFAGFADLRWLEPAAVALDAAAAEPDTDVKTHAAVDVPRGTRRRLT